MHFRLEKFVTKDNFILNGLFFNPKKKSNKALLFIHGFPGNFYQNSEIIISLAGEFQKSGLGLFSINTRGHDIINVTFKKSGGFSILGGTFEKFADCILDIEAGIKFLNSRGFNEIFLAGISGGADKVGFYLSKTHNKSIKGGVFLSPGSNISIAKKELKNEFKPMVKKAFGMVRKNKGNELILGPRMDFPVSWQRFISLYDEESNENIFPFHDKKTEFRYLTRIKVPLLIVMGNKDEYFDNLDLGKITELLRQKMKNITNSEVKIIKNANHQVKGKEKGLAVIITNWIDGIKGG